MVPVKNNNTDLTINSDCSSSNAIMGDADKSTYENAVEQLDHVNQLDILSVICQRSLGIFTASYFLMGDVGDLADNYNAWSMIVSYGSARCILMGVAKFSVNPLWRRE
jgi:hypothetical protein